MVGKILINLLKVDIHTGLAMYDAVISAPAKRAMVLAAAKEALGEDDTKLFAAVLKVTRPACERRNEFAHHLWACSDDLPGCLLLINPKHETRIDADRADMSLGTMGRTRPMPEMPTLPFDKFMVYDRDALVECVAIARRAHGLISQLEMVLSPRWSDMTEVRQWLLAAPEIQQALQPQYP